MHRTILAALALFLIPVLGRGEERASTKEAEAMVHSAVAFVKKEGKEKAIAVFNDPKGAFTYRDLYVTTLTLDGKLLSNAHRKDRIGKNFLDMPPAQFRAVWQQVLDQGKGWVEYKYNDPASGKTENKVVYAEIVDGCIVSCGAYRQ